jgi:hypothetical protein
MILVFGLISKLLGGSVHGSECIEVMWRNITIKNPHEVIFREVDDKFLIKVDGKEICSERVDDFGIINRKFFHIDGVPVEFRWSYNVWNIKHTNIESLILVHDDTIIAQHGNARAAVGLPKKVYPTQEPPQALPNLSTNVLPSSTIKILKEENTKEDIRVVSIVPYPLDNTNGTGTIFIEEQISKTVTNEVSVNIQLQAEGDLSARILDMVQAEIAGSLARNMEETFGQSITQSRNIKFSAEPGDFTIYEVIWQQKVRSGEYLVSIDGKQSKVSYDAFFDLSYEIKSRKGSPS